MEKVVVDTFNCHVCSGDGWVTVPSVVSSDEYEQEECHFCKGAGQFVVLNTGEIEPIPTPHFK